MKETEDRREFIRRKREQGLHTGHGLGMNVRPAPGKGYIVDMSYGGASHVAQVGDYFAVLEAVQEALAEAFGEE